MDVLAKTDKGRHSKKARVGGRSVTTWALRSAASMPSVEAGTVHQWEGLTMTTMISDTDLQAAIGKPALFLVVGRPDTGKLRYLIELGSQQARAGRTVRLQSLARPGETVAYPGVDDIQVDDTDALTLEKIIQRAKKLPSGALLMIDYVQRIRRDARSNRSLAKDNEWHTERLRDAALELGLTFLMTGQLNHKYAGTSTLDNPLAWMQGADGAVFLSESDAPPDSTGDGLYITE
jgi:hypothetical protein